MAEEGKPLRILSLDGGGAKGFYTLGVLKEVEALVGRPLSQMFDLIFGTSTGSIIAALLALGWSVDAIHDQYKQHVVAVLGKTSPSARSAALAALGQQVFGNTTFDAFQTGIGIVATKWVQERPMIFKADPAQAHGRQGTFAPGFGCTISDAVQASCSAYPFFERKTITTSQGDTLELIDGGYCANNPTLYAIADAVRPLGRLETDLRVLSVGVGVYPPVKHPLFSKQRLINAVPSVKLVQKVLEINTQSMDQLGALLFKDVPYIRINDTFEQPEMATDLFECDLTKLNVLRQRGRESFARHEPALKNLLS
jgi:patatin-like phospholipase/acyl hydrolase